MKPIRPSTKAALVLFTLFAWSTSLRLNSLARVRTAERAFHEFESSEQRTEDATSPRESWAAAQGVAGTLGFLTPFGLLAASLGVFLRWRYATTFVAGAVALEAALTARLAPRAISGPTLVIWLAYLLLALTFAFYRRAAAKLGGSDVVA